MGTSEIVLLIIGVALALAAVFVFLLKVMSAGNDIDVYWQQSYHHLNDLCYHLDKFMAACIRLSRVQI